MSNNDLEGDDIWGDSSGGGGDDESKNNEESKEVETSEAGTSTAVAAAAEPAAAAEQQQEDPAEDDETRTMTNSELRQRIHLLSSDIRVMKSDVQRITHESRGQRDRIRENQEKVKLNKQLPYLVANVVEILEPDAEDGKYKYSAMLCYALFCFAPYEKKKERKIRPGPARYFSITQKYLNWWTDVRVYRLYQIKDYIICMPHTLSFS
jgi:hypothetical protein